MEKNWKNFCGIIKKEVTWKNSGFNFPYREKKTGKFLWVAKILKEQKIITKNLWDVILYISILIVQFEANPIKRKEVSLMTASDLSSVFDHCIVYKPVIKPKRRLRLVYWLLCRVAVYS